MRFIAIGSDGCNVTTKTIEAEDDAYAETTARLLFEDESGSFYGVFTPEEMRNLAANAESDEPDAYADRVAECNGCGCMVRQSDPFFATPDGTYCGVCVPDEIMKEMQ